MNAMQGVYIKNGNVYLGTRQLPIKNQRGRQYVHLKGRQVNIKSIPVLKREWDLFDWYVLSGLFHSHHCVVMDWWMEMRMVNSYVDVRKIKNI